MKRFLAHCALAVVVVATTSSVFGDEAADREAIRGRVKSYVEAYNAGDAEALAAHWSEKAVYVKQDSGEEIKGRAAIEAMFKTQFADGNRVELSATVDSIRFVTSNVAVEEGVARVVGRDEAPSESNYTAIHVKDGDKWYLDSVRETVIPSQPSHHEHLKQLSWLIGEWEDEGDDGMVRTKCQWTKNHNFITRSFSVHIQGRIDMEGTQVIGWDAALGRIRSWTFDTKGGFGEAVWSVEGDKWTIKTKAVLPDGRRGSRVVVMKKIDDNKMTLQTVTREVDGEILPNIDEFSVVKVSGK